MAAARRAHVLPGDVRRQTARYQGEILLQGHVDPALFAARIGIGQLERFDGTRQIIEHIAGDLAQQLLSGCQLPLRGNDRCRAGIVGGARFLDVGDGDQADVVALLGLLELTIDRGQIALLRVDVVLRREHVEIALRHARDEVLLRRLVIRLGLRDLRIRALQGHPILPAEQVLLEVDAVMVSGRRDAAVEGKALENRGAAAAARHLYGLDQVRRSLVVFLADGAVRRQLRQQRGERLRLRFERGQTIGFGLSELRIVLQGALIDGQQVRRRRAASPREQTTGEQTQYTRCHLQYCGILGSTSRDHARMPPARLNTEANP